MIVLFLSCGVIYLKNYAVRIWVGFPGGVGRVCTQLSSTLLDTWDLGKHETHNTQAADESKLTSNIFLVEL